MMQSWLPRAPTAALAVVLVLGFACPGHAAERRVELRLRAGSFDPVLDPSPLPDRLRLARTPEEGYFVAQFDRPIDASLLDELRARGARPLQYLPERGYLLRLPAGTRSELRGLAGLRWLGPVEPGWKLSPALRSTGDGPVAATVDLFPGESPDPLIRALIAAGVQVVRSVRFSDTRRVEVRAEQGQLEQLARRPDVAWIEPVGRIALRNDTARWVVQTNVQDSTTVWDRGLHGEGEIIGHIDGQIDIESCYFRDPDDNTPGPDHRKIVAYRSSTGLGSNAHGTHTAGTAAGDRGPTSGGTAGNGHAYAARISFSSIWDVSEPDVQPSNLYDFLAAAHADGARIHTNSWGDDFSSAYGTWSRDVDLFAYDFEEALVVFSVANGGPVRSPENAKNCLAVGASQNGANAGMLCSAAVGPTPDGRRKPEILAPGCGVLSAAEGVSCGTYPESGTSMASPAVAGAGALARQYFREGWYPSGSSRPEDARLPSGALLKATLLNSAVDMTGLAGYPGNQEGWGRLLLENALYFDGDPRRLVVLADVLNAAGLSTGLEDGFGVLVDGSSEPLVLTLAFTEPPAALLAEVATVNDLDLELLAPSGLLYRGNVFDTSAGESLPGGSADPLNNVEMIRIAEPEAGTWIVNVRGTAVNQGLQGYALIATGQVAPGEGGSLRYLEHEVLDAAPLGNADGVADPGETITLPLSLLNLRASPAIAVTARLSTPRPDLAQVTRNAASFPDMAAGATAGSLPPHFLLTLAPDLPCGTSIPFDLRAEHAGGSSISTFHLFVGDTSLTLTSSDTPLELPPFSGAPTVSQIEVAPALTLADVQVGVRIRHDDIGEAVVELTSPSATTVTLHNETGSGTADLDTVFDSETLPDGPGSMSWFDGEAAQGVWSLAVSDRVVGTPQTPGGTLEEWTLTLESAGGAFCQPLECAGDPVPAPVPPELRVNAQGGTDLLFAWPAVRGAERYRVWRSATPDFAREEWLLETDQTSALQPGGLVEPGNWYYRVRAVNSCNWEGP